MTAVVKNTGLVLPSNYVSIDKDEMEYIEGGANGWWNSRACIAGAIDIAIAIYTAGVALNTLSTLKAFLKANKNKLVYQVRGQIAGIFGSAAAQCVPGAIDIALTVMGTSIGGLIAYGIDYFDANRLNGYCFG